jgi:hypothetical protein
MPLIATGVSDRNEVGMVAAARCSQKDRREPMRTVKNHDRHRVSKRGIQPASNITSTSEDP